MFERYGGFTNINRIVDRLYEKALAQPEVAPFFAETQMMRLVDHQTKFVATVMGGPTSYSDKQLAQIHATLGIDQAAFNAVLNVLRETLEEFGVAEDDKREILKIFHAKAALIVTRGQVTEPAGKSQEQSGSTTPLSKDLTSLLDMLETAICIVDRRTLAPVFKNPAFGAIFGDIGPSSPLTAMIPGLDQAEMKAGLAKAGRYDCRCRAAQHAEPLSISIRSHDDFPDWLMCECRN
jgi:hemoglobin